MVRISRTDPSIDDWPFIMFYTISLRLVGWRGVTERVATGLWFSTKDANYRRSMIVWIIRSCIDPTLISDVFSLASHLLIRQE